MDTQRQRRVKYGLNVVIAAAAAVGLVVLLNWIADRQLRKNLPPAAKRWVRYDLTATRSYSLSKQTLGVLKSLKDPYKVVTLLDPQSPYIDPSIAQNIDQARDLLNEYQNYSTLVTVEHLSPIRQATQVDAFHASLRARYDEQLKPVAAAIDAGRQALERTRQDVTGLIEPLRRLLDNPALGESPLREFVASLAQAFGRFDSDLETAGKELKRSLDSALPNYAGARRSVQDLLGDLDGKVFAIAIDNFHRAARDESTHASVKDALLMLSEKLEELRKGVQEALASVRKAETVSDYDQLRAQLQSEANTVVIVGPKQVQVFKLTDLFRAAQDPMDESGQAQGTPRLEFLGEERITGSLASMSLEYKPMVVFVHSGTSDPLGRGNPQSSYSQVAQRLRNMNLEVRSWSPMPRQNPFGGQPMPPEPAPEPAAGQKAVWVVLPTEPPDPRNPMGMSAPQQITELIQERLEKGDGMLFMLAANPYAQFGPPDPIAPMLKDWGLTAELDRVVIRQLLTPDRRRQVIAQHEVRRWPGDMPVTRTLASFNGVFLFASPLTLAKDDAKAKTWPLVVLEAPDMWAETNFASLRNAAKNEATAADRFVVGAAAEKGEHRVVVVADPVWATDYVVTAGPRDLFTGVVYPLYPGNAELFVNSVYWLAHLDSLIAAGARTQDIRRIDPISDAGLIAVRWVMLAGLPLAAVAAGLGVWFVRRSA